MCGDYEIGVVMKVDCPCRRKLDKLTCPYYPTNLEGWGITVIAAWVKLHDCYYELKGSEPQWANSLHCVVFEAFKYVCYMQYVQVKGH